MSSKFQADLVSSVVQVICNFQGVLDDIGTLQGNVDQLNDIVKNLVENCDKDYKEQLEKEAKELNQNWKKVTDLAKSQNKKLKVRCTPVVRMCGRKRDLLKSCSCHCGPPPRPPQQGFLGGCVWEIAWSLR